MDLTCKCYHWRGNSFKDTFQEGWSSARMTGQSFICRFYKDQERVASVEFQFVSEDTVYIVKVDRHEKGEKGVASRLLMDTLRKAKKRGAKFAVLEVSDGGSGKLYKYYYNLGFRCVGNKLIKYDDEKDKEYSMRYRHLVHNREIPYNDFEGEELRARNTKLTQNCYYMRMNLNIIGDD
jgi:predicted GNAT superfamily acetyltransferase